MSTIETAIEALRNQYASLSLAHIPIDILEFVELDLQLDMWPEDGLERKHSVDAAITSDFKAVYIDKDKYELLNNAKNPRRGMDLDGRLKRLRFTLAHEIGHYYLHKEVYGDAGIRTVADLKKWHTQQAHYKYETEANEFAGELLVPTGHLKLKFETVMNQMIQAKVSFKSLPKLLQQQCRNRFIEDTSSATCYAVNQAVVDIRLHKKRIWPQI